MRILIVNDDSINAEGLSELELLAKSISDDVWVVAPEVDQSAISHALTTITPLRVRQLGDKKFAVNGTPADCALMAIDSLLPGKPDLLISGINLGSNVGKLLVYSGTLAAAREGALQSIKSIAFSQACSYDYDNKKVHVDWSVARKYGAQLLQKLIKLEIPSNVFLNVNFPLPVENVKTEVLITRQQLHGGYVMRVQPSHDGLFRPLYWLAGARENDVEPDVGTDSWAVNAGHISITPLSLDLTAGSLLSQLQTTDFNL